MAVEYNKPLIIVNPNSCGGKTGKNFVKSLKILNDSKLFEKIDVFESITKEDTIQKVVELHDGKNDYDMIISLGGDGTISTICNGLMKVDLKKRLPLLPIPAGTGNSLLRDFHVKSIHDSLNKFRNNESKMIDILSLEEINGDYKWYCVNVIGLGFVCNLAKYSVEKFNKFGAMKYILGTFAALNEFKPYKATIKYNDGKKVFQSEKVYFLTFSNSMYSGGTVKIAPEALLDDGLMDVIILHDLSRLKFLYGYMQALSGKHIYEKVCSYFKTRNIEIYLEPDSLLMPDGELEGSSPIKIRVLPREIKILL